jgi:mRNA-degrading endonuclease toxin of MazEF toxin-antitoxin module
VIRQRGYIYYARLPDVDKPKMALVVSADFVNEFLQPVVVQVTSKDRIRVFPTDVRLRPPEGGVSELSYALCHEIATLDDDVIEPEPVGRRLSDATMIEVERALQLALGIS